MRRPPAWLTPPPALARLGLDLEAFGPGAILVRALPAALGTPDPQHLVRDIADELTQLGETTALDQRLDAVIARLACHGSIRAGRRMNLPRNGRAAPPDGSHPPRRHLQATAAPPSSASPAPKSNASSAARDPARNAQEKTAEAARKKDSPPRAPRDTKDTKKERKHRFRPLSVFCPFKIADFQMIDRLQFEFRSRAG